MSPAQDFWSRRRAAVAAEDHALRSDADDKTMAEDKAALAAMPEDEALEALALPDPDTLKAGDDFAAFMKEAVPEAIRRRALRTLWRSNPLLANVDMLVDYGEDFTDSATVVANLQTSYQVGKGMLKHIEELARAAEAEVAEDETPEEADETEMLLTDDDTDDPVEEVAAESVPDARDSHDDDLHTPRPRRMTFRVEATA